MAENEGRMRIARTRLVAMRIKHAFSLRDPYHARPAGRHSGRNRRLKRVAIFQIRSARFRFLILRMSLSRNRFPLSGDML
jgi:hypothetical protein